MQLGSLYCFDFRIDSILFSQEIPISTLVNPASQIYTILKSESTVFLKPRRLNISLGKCKEAADPQVRGKIIGHDNKRLAFKFTMLNDGKVVQCQISDAHWTNLPNSPASAPVTASRTTIV